MKLKRVKMASKYKTWFPKRCHCSLHLIVKKWKFCMPSSLQSIKLLIAVFRGVDWTVYGFKHLILVPPHFQMLSLIILLLNICKTAFCGGKCEAVGNLQQPEFIQGCAIEAQSSQFIHNDYEVNTIWWYHFIFNINPPVFQKESFNNE